MLKSFAKSAVVAATIAVAGVGIAAPSASAASVTVSVWGAQGQFDNNPGNGAASWIWAYTGSNYSARLDYQYYNDNTVRHLDVNGRNTSASANLSSDVWRIRICVPAGAMDGVTWVCSNWS
ncbi:hypothetical protein AB0K81_27500 [Streptomyces werraensis]|uniref:Secreted protein n=1 Tax=Streptomyces werraensis TaxID=68284 RepID=A0ABV3JMR6_9ACTN